LGLVPLVDEKYEKEREMIKFEEILKKKFVLGSNPRVKEAAIREVIKMK